MARASSILPAVHLARLAVDEASAGRISDLLAESLDPAETTVAAFETDRGWIVEVQFRQPPDETAIRDLLALIAGHDAASGLTFETLQPRDWTRASLEGLKPVEAGRFVVHGGHDRARVAAPRIGIEIEAALAFGTGHHGTTRGCLLAIDRIARARNPRRIIDIGTGTGVLAIAAAKAFRRPILATDIDVQAVAVAKGNARLNHVAPLIEFAHANGLGARRIRVRGPYDLILANILLSPLRQLAAPMARLIAPNGHIVLSGLLASQGSAAIAAYRAQGFALKRRIILDNWVTLTLVRHRLSGRRTDSAGSADRCGSAPDVD
jgi:ribosomal protein L11 methyltransferase